MPERGSRTGALCIVACLAAVAASTCKQETPTTCAAPEGAGAPCEDACANLFRIGCRVGNDVTECVQRCMEAGSSLDEATRDRVQACYVLANDCAQVDGCSLTCGPGGTPVPFADGGAPAIDAGSPEQDAGPSELDAGTPEQDAAMVEPDAGTAGPDAGADASGDAA